MKSSAQNWSQDTGKADVLPCCTICSRVPDEGIRGGFKLRRVFICRDCEINIVKLTTDSPDYDLILEKLKQIY